MSNESFIKEWFEGKRTNPRTGGRRYHQNLESDGRSLYSCIWRTFVLVKETDFGEYILNGDSLQRYIASHQWETRSQAYKHKVRYVEIPYSALELARIPIREVKIISKMDDRYRTRLVKDPETGEKRKVEEHLLGGCILSFDGKCFLSSTDAGARWGFGYFLTELPVQVKNVAEAFRVLKPEIVRRAERNTKDVKRQGEWFFLPFGSTRKLMKFLNKKRLFFEPSLKVLTERQKLLPIVSQNGSEPHHCVRDCVVGLYDELFVRGTVRHTLRGHKMLSLGEVWHQAVPNTQIRSWSVEMRVD